MSLIPQFKIELQYIPTVKACLKLSQVDCFFLRLKGSRPGGPASVFWATSAGLISTLLRKIDAVPML